MRNIGKFGNINNPRSQTSDLQATCHTLIFNENAGKNSLWILIDAIRG